MKMFTTMGDNREPIAAPSSCLKKESWNWKYVEFRQRLVRWQICCGGRGVLSSSQTRCLASASFTGTTSKLIILLSPASSLVSQIVSAKSDGFLMNKLVWPARGFRIFARNFAMLLVGDPIAETIGRSGVPSSWTWVVHRTGDTVVEMLLLADEALLFAFLDSMVVVETLFNVSSMATPPRPLQLWRCICPHHNGVVLAEVPCCSA